MGNRRVSDFFWCMVLPAKNRTNSVTRGVKTQILWTKAREEKDKLQCGGIITVFLPIWANKNSNEKIINVQTNKLIGVVVFIKLKTQQKSNDSHEKVHYSNCDVMTIIVFCTCYKPLASEIKIELHISQMDNLWIKENVKKIFEYKALNDVNGDE